MQDASIPIISTTTMLEEVRKVLSRLKYRGTATVEYWATPTMKHAYDLSARDGGMRIKSGIPNQSGPGYLVQVVADFVAPAVEDEISESGDVIRRGNGGYKCPAILLIIDGTNGMAMSYKAIKSPRDFSTEGPPTVVEI